MAESTELSLTQVYEGELLPVDDVVALLDDLDDVEEVADMSQRLEAAKTYDSKTAERQRYWGELVIWSDRRLGELIIQGKRNGEIAGGGRPQKRSHDATVLQLDALGLDKHRSQRSQRLARLPVQDVRDYIQQQHEAAEEITKAGVIRHVAAIRKEAKAARRVEDLPSSTCEITDLEALAESGAQFGTIYADPPWQYGNQGTRAATDNHYDTMTVEEICELPIARLAAEDSHLHLWTTNGFLFDAKRVIEAWGFTYKSCMVWVKPQMGLGNYWRVSHEFLLLGVRGSCEFGDKSLKSWLEVPRRKHSKKPVEFRGMVEKVSPGPRLELFGRIVIDGWAVWGNEVERILPFGEIEI